MSIAPILLIAAMAGIVAGTLIGMLAHSPVTPLVVAVVAFAFSAWSAWLARSNYRRLRDENRP
jgi:uncharacterized membrane protein YadS